MTALSIVRRDLIRFARSPVRTALMFAMPLMLAGIFALVFGGGGGGDITLKVLLWNEDEGLLSRLLESVGSSSETDQRLELVPVGAEGLEKMEQGEASALVHIPAGFTADFLAGRPLALEVIKNPAQRFLPLIVEEGLTLGAVVLSEASLVLRPELAALGGMTSGEETTSGDAVGLLASSIHDRLADVERFVFPPVINLEAVTLETEGAATTSDVDVLSYFLPGISLMGVLFLAQAATRDILRDRETGLLRHLLTAPVTARDYLAGKCLSVFVVTSVGFAVLVAIGLVVGVSWGDPVAAAALVVASSLAASGSLLLIMSLVGSERQGDALTTIVIIVWSMLGGAFVPISQMPSFLEPLCRTTPTYWATEAFNRIILSGGGIADIALNLVVLTVAGMTLLALGSAVLGRKIAAGML